jgi:hypothetical protein
MHRHDFSPAAPRFSEAGFGQAPIRTRETALRKRDDASAEHAWNPSESGHSVRSEDIESFGSSTVAKRRFFDVIQRPRLMVLFRGCAGIPARTSFVQKGKEALYPSTCQTHRAGFYGLLDKTRQIDVAQERRRIPVRRRSKKNRLRAGISEHQQDFPGKALQQFYRSVRMLDGKSLVAILSGLAREPTGVIRRTRTPGKDENPDIVVREKPRQRTR